MNVVSFTTTPSRIDKCEKMINSILNQDISPDLFIINIPKKFGRGDEEYVIPDFVKDACTINFLEKDYGPATKLVGAVKYLKSKSVKDANIVYLDDDVEYPSGMLSSMLKVRKSSPYQVHCSSGINIDPYEIYGFHWATEPDIFCSIPEGFAGVSCTLSMFEKSFEDFVDEMIKDEDFYLSDDMVFGVYFALKRIPVRTVHFSDVYNRDMCLWSLTDYANLSDGLFAQTGGHPARYSRCYKKLKDSGAWPLPVIEDNNRLLSPAIKSHYMSTMLRRDAQGG
jgi:hypothetical protein